MAQLELFTCRQIWHERYSTAPMTLAHPKHSRKLELSAYLARTPAVRFDAPAYAALVLSKLPHKAADLGDNQVLLGESHTSTNNGLVMTRASKATAIYVPPIDDDPRNRVQVDSDPDFVTVRLATDDWTT